MIKNPFALGRVFNICRVVKSNNLCATMIVFLSFKCVIDTSVNWMTIEDNLDRFHSSTQHLFDSSCFLHRFSKARFLIKQRTCGEGNPNIFFVALTDQINQLSFLFYKLQDICKKTI